MLKSLRFGAAAALFVTVATDPAFAGFIPAPGPMVGAGAPALAVFGIGYWLVRRRRRA
jgi:hypothetical protein